VKAFLITCIAAGSACMAAFLAFVALKATGGVSMMLILLASITFIATLFATETKGVSLVDVDPELVGATAIGR
jgi:hypothetical protein